MSTWFITGCSTGFGRALAEAALADGHRVALAVRDTSTVADLVADHGENALAVTLDVTDPAQAVAAIDEATAHFGGIDVLVNNAGYGVRAAIEEADIDDVERLFATNVFGPITLMRAVLPQMRRRRSGTIVNFSSVGSVLRPAGSGYYSASKAALDGISDTLRKEVEPLGIRVVAVQPGPFRTDFAGRSLVGSGAPIADYSETVGPRRKENDTAHGTQPGDPEKAARVLVDLVDGDRLPAFLLLGADAHRLATEAVSATLAEYEAWKDVAVSTDFD